MCKYYKNEIVEGCVTGIEKYGIFITLDEYYSGLIHISEVSDSFVKDINKYVKVGETIKARVLDVADDTFHVKLSIKNIDYRILNKREAIKETPKGFSTLNKELQNWINMKKN